MQIGRSYCPLAGRMAEIVCSQKEPKTISNEFRPKPTQRTFGQGAEKGKILGSKPTCGDAERDLLIQRCEGLLSTSKRVSFATAEKVRYPPSA